MKMDIALSCDNNYVQHLAVAIQSIIENNVNNEIMFHIMDNGIEANILNKIIKQIKKNKCAVTVYDFSDMENEYKFSSRSKVLPIAAYSRIFLIDKLDKTIKRILYMDVDMVCCTSLENLFMINLEDKIVGGVQDFAAINAREKNGYSIMDRYINSGMMLIDVEKWKNINATSEIHKYILERDGNVVQEDQGAINAVLKKYIKILHPRYNCMTPFYFWTSEQIKRRFQIGRYYSDKEIKEAVKDPVIIHYLKFNGWVNRPWEEHCIHPKKKEYFKYIQKTEWANSRLKSDKRTLIYRLNCFYHLKISTSVVGRLIQKI